VTTPLAAPAAGAPPLTLAHFPAEAARRFGGREALVFDDPLTGDAAGDRSGDRTVRWTYDRLRDESRRVARALVADGVEPGMRVAIVLGNRPEALAALFGAAAAGAVGVLVSTFAPRPELGRMLELAEPRIVVTQTRLSTHRHADDVAALRDRLPTLANVVAVGDDWDDWLARADEAAADGLDAEVDDRTALVEPDDDGLVIFSSGTTETPKGMLHTQYAPVLQFHLQGRIFRRDTDTRMWTPLPVFWSAGLVSAIGATLATGGTSVLAETFDPAAALALLARESVTEPYALPHQNLALAEHADWGATDLSSLRAVYGKSVYARHPTVHGDPDWTMPVGYGLSETCAFFSAHDAATPRERMRASHGRLLPGNEVRVVDPASGAPVRDGDEGELTIKGPSLMRRYLGRAPADCVDERGFFHTGDLGHVDAAGEVHFAGRIGEMIKTAGANVSPAELEVALRAFPPVKLARIVGVPDPRLDEVVVACVTLAAGASADADDIKSFLRERVSSYKVPRHVVFFDDGEIPMTSAGSKVKDRELTALVTARLNGAP
jgi:acyl-CoA synthetase (AMP-forming)/AMP-acid ligase II